MHPTQLWWRDCSNSISLLSVSGQKMNALFDLHWKWCLLGHGRGRRMKGILGRLYLKRRKLPLIPFPANKHQFEIQHRKMKRTWRVRTAQSEEKHTFSTALSEHWHFACPSWVLIPTMLVHLIPFQRKLLCCVPGLYVGAVRSGLTFHARTKTSGEEVIFTVICKEKAANRQIPDCCSGVGKFFKATGSGAPHTQIQLLQNQLVLISKGLSNQTSNAFFFFFFAFANSKKTGPLLGMAGCKDLSRYPFCVQWREAGKLLKKGKNKPMPCCCEGVK